MWKTKNKIFVEFGSFRHKEYYTLRNKQTTILSTHLWDKLNADENNLFIVSCVDLIMWSNEEK